MVVGLELKILCEVGVKILGEVGVKMSLGELGLSLSPKITSSTFCRFNGLIPLGESDSCLSRLVARLDVRWSHLVAFGLGLSLESLSFFLKLLQTKFFESEELRSLERDLKHFFGSNFQTGVAQVTNSFLSLYLLTKALSISESIVSPLNSFNPLTKDFLLK